MSNSLYRPEIDGLRAISVMAVMLFHAGLACPGGYVGVDVFFVISGYLITGLIRKDLDEGTFTLAGFWERRVRRIFPASLVMTTSVLVSGYFLLLPDELEMLGKSAVGHLTCLSNIYFWSKSGVDYFGDSADLFPLLHTWSLAVEEQFYFFLPLLLLGLRNRNRRTWTIVLGALGIISFVLSCMSVRRYPYAAFYLLSSRSWELLIGAGVAMWARQGRPWPRMIAEMGSLAGLSGIFASIVLYDKSTPFPGWAALLPCLGCAAVIGANTHNKTNLGRLLSWTPLAAIGTISYSLYLWHWPIFSFYRILFDELPPAPQVLLLVAVSVFVGWCSWRFVESPFRIRRFGGTRRVLFGQALMVSTTLLLVAVVFWRSQGLVDRVPSRLMQDLSYTGDGYQTRANIAAGEYPRLGSPIEERIDFVLWGDSHGLAIAEALSDAARERGITGRVAAKAGTAPIVGLLCQNDATQLPWNEAVFGFILRHKVKYVLLVARWSYYLNGLSDIDVAATGDTDRTSSLVRLPTARSTSAETARRDALEKLDEMVKKLRQNNVQIWILQSVPEQSQGRIGRHWLRTRVTGIGWLNSFQPQPYSSSNHRRQTAPVDTVLEQVALRNEGVLLVDPVPALFDGDGALPVRDDRCLYRDDDHVSFYGAKRLVETSLTPLLDDITHRAHRVSTDALR